MLARYNGYGVALRAVLCPFVITFNREATYNRICMLNIMKTGLLLRPHAPPTDKAGSDAYYRCRNSSILGFDVGEDGEDEYLDRRDCKLSSETAAVILSARLRDARYLTSFGLLSWRHRIYNMVVRKRAVAIRVLFVSTQPAEPRNAKHGHNIQIEAICYVALHCIHAVMADNSFWFDEYIIVQLRQSHGCSRHNDLLAVGSQNTIHSPAHGTQALR